MSKFSVLSVCSLFAAALAAPSPVQQDARAVNPFPSKITNQAQLDSIVSGLEADATALALGASVVVDLITAIVPSPTPASIAAELSSVASVYKAHPTSFFQSAFDLFLNGLSPADTFNLVLGESPLENSSNNINLIPAFGIYPKKSPQDAPYSVPEAKLRAAIYIPFGFTYGRVKPIIFVPGTGVTAGANFAPNFGKLFRGSSYADPVYLNIPNNQLDDVQINSEYVAYAINYISAISRNSKVSVLTWSAGSLDAQWAFQYWPSTRPTVTDMINISPDFHGTVLAYLLCPPFPNTPCPPAVLQQEYNAKFIKTIRNGGGDSAYVPTTTIYSIFDEIVQPQEGTGASAFILDRRNVGVSNTEVQNACTLLQPAGTLYTHEGVLYNPVAVALAIDALTHDGPGQLSRINLPAECQKIAADGLSLADVLATEALIPVAGFNILTYPAKVTSEPPIKAYAAKDTPAA